MLVFHVHAIFHVLTLFHVFVFVSGESTEILKIDQAEATEIAKQLSNLDKEEFRRYMVDASGDDGRRLLAIAGFMQDIGFNSSYFD